MTKKDYELIAKAIHEEWEAADDRFDTTLDVDTARTALNMLTNLLAARLRADNSRFDTERFYLAATGRYVT